MGAEAELREPEAGIREFGAGLGISGIYMGKWAGLAMRRMGLLVRGRGF